MRTGKLKELPPYVDLRKLGEGADVDFYARNWQGLHVPISTMTVSDMEDAWAVSRGFLLAHKEAA